MKFIITTFFYFLEYCTFHRVIDANDKEELTMFLIYHLV